MSLAKVKVIIVTNLDLSSKHFCIINWKFTSSGRISLWQKFSNVEDPDLYPLFIISAVETPDVLALELEADLVKWLAKVLVSIPDKFKTVIIHLDIVNVDTLNVDQ